MGIRYLFFFFIMLVVACGPARNSVSKSSNSSDYPILTKDLLGNVYTVDSLGKIEKHSIGSSVVPFYQNKYYGKPTNIDVFNPQKIIVYYGKYNKLVILDQTLSSEREVDLERDLGWQVGSVAQASDLNLWIYSLLDRTVKKISMEGMELVTSDPLNFFTNQTFVPERIVEKNGQVYLANKELGWIRLDLFGQFIDQLNQPHDWFFINEKNQLIYLREGAYFAWQPGYGIPKKLEEVPSWMTRL